MHNIILKPIITEQSMAEAEKGRFSFRVAKLANKPTIRQAIHDHFSVDVVSVMTTVVKGKTKRVGKTRQEIHTVSYKKAVVQLKEGQKISLFELGGK